MAEGRSRRRAGHPRLQYVRGALAACAVAASLSIAAAAAGSGTVIPTGNLLQNPGAEAAPGSNGSGGPVPIPSWTTQTITGDSPTTQGFTVVAYGSPAFPDSAVSAQIGGGANFFGGGNATALSTAAQTVDVSGAAAEIDAGQASALLSADIGGYDGQTDSGIVAATFSVREATRSRPSQSAPSRKLTETARRRCCLAPPPSASRPGRGRSQ